MDTISNFYENLVFEKIKEITKNRQITLSNEGIQDIACLALNQLPARYVRHSIDTIFYIPDEERAQIDRDVEISVSAAVDKVVNNPR